MANSGVTLKEEAMGVYTKLQKNHKLKYILFDLDQGSKFIEVIKEGPKESKFEDFIMDLMGHGACYAVYDFKYKKENGAETNKIFFVSWCPETSTPIKRKMLQSSSKDALRKKLDGIGKEIQACDADDITMASFIGQLTDIAKGCTTELD